MNVLQWVREAFGVSLKAETIQFWQVALRGVLVYAALIIILRFAKKRTLGRATALDVVIVITIGSLASRGITGNAPLVNSLAAVIALVAVHWLVSLVTRDHSTISDWIKGRPSRIVENGKVDQEALVAAHMSDDDLAEDLRQKGVSGPEEVKLAMLERSGQLSVIKDEGRSQRHRRRHLHIDRLPMVTAVDRGRGADDVAGLDYPGRQRRSWAPFASAARSLPSARRPL